VKFRPLDKVETNFTKTSFDIVAKQQQCRSNVRLCRNNSRLPKQHCRPRPSIRQCCFDSVAGVDVALEWAGICPSKVPFAVRSGPHLLHGSLGPHESTSKRHLDRFNRFYSAYPVAQRTHRRAHRSRYIRSLASMHCVKANSLSSLSLFIAYSGWSFGATRRHSCRSAAFRQAVWMPKFM